MTALKSISTSQRKTINELAYCLAIASADKIIFEKLGSNPKILENYLATNPKAKQLNDAFKRAVKKNTKQVFEQLADQIEKQEEQK